MSAAKWGHSPPQEFVSGSALACPLLGVPVAQDPGYRILALGPQGPAITARVLGFSPVVPDQPDASEGNRRAGVLARILELKKQHPLPAGKVLPQTFDFSLGRTQQCPRVEEFDSFANRFPQWGMPFGLPPLSESEHRTLTD